MSLFDSTTTVQLESIEILSSSCQNESEETYQSFLFKCTLCPLKFNDKLMFQSHVRDHFKPITCDDCKKTFIGDKQYSYHRRHVHGSSTTNESGQCDDSARMTVTRIKVNSQKKCADEDIDSVEIVAANSACDICGRLFPNEAAVERHRKTHSNEGKRFFCHICNNGFNKKTNLEFHLRIHTNERPFKCDQCPKSFSHVSGLNCHRRIHTGQRPYRCPFCAKSYAHSTDLRRHRRTHGQEEARFKCDLCQKTFFEGKFLRTHMRTHHRDQATSKSGSDARPTSIDKFDECMNIEYIDYEYIQSD
ncbi:hypothetical protein HA402_004426 [Bradysia odoriphaga]|nr:hypothetical protein HA402_004426 [Bradysia odoriphaga]